MFAKLLVIVVFATTLAAVLLGLRQHRIEVMHDMTRLHSTIDDARLRTWDLQVRIAERIEPAALREAVERAGLALEPVVMTPSQPAQPADRIAEAGYGPH